MHGLIAAGVMQRYDFHLHNCSHEVIVTYCSCMVHRGADMRYWELKEAEEGVGFE